MEDLNRTFIGIRLSPEIQQKLGEVQQTLRHKAGSDVLRFNPINTIHIVILPLGELMVGTFDQVRRNLPGLAQKMKGFHLSLEGAGGTPSALQPRFVWIGVGEGAQELTSVHDSLEANLRTLIPGYQPKPFQPHIDLGRIKVESEQNRTAIGRAVRMSQVGCVFEFDVKSIELFRSTAGPLGPQLVSEGTFALGS